MKSSLRFSVAMAMVLCVAGCDVEFGYFAKDRTAAEAAVNRFRALYAKGDYEGIYALGAPELQQAVSLAQFVSTAQTTMENLGPLKSTRQAAASCFPNQVRFAYSSEFEKGPATELMAWAVHQGKANLLLYKVTPGRETISPGRGTACPA